MKKASAALVIIMFSVFAMAQETLLPVGDSGLEKRSWVLLDTTTFVKGERPIEVPETLLGGRVVNYVAFYVDGTLIAVDEIPPYRVTHDFGNYTHKAQIIVIGVQYKLEKPEETVAALSSQAEQGGERSTETESTTATHVSTADPESIGFAIVSPTAENYAYGVGTIKVTLDLRVEEILRIDFLVDDVQAGSVSAPPYEVEFDFGRGFESKRVRAVAVLADGRQILREINTRPLEKSDYFIRTRLVTLEATVVDWRDRLVGDMKAEEFRIFENGKEQKVSHFSIENRPIRVALLIDTSGSMRYRGRMDRAIASAQQFLDFLRPEKDKAAIVAFTDQVTILSRFTNDFKKLKKKIGELEPEGGTAINDALDRVAPLFDDETGRKAIILITDGFDENSEVSIGNAVESVRRNGIKVYSIGIFEYDVRLQEALAVPRTHRGKAPDVDPEDARKGNRAFKKGEDVRKVLFEGLADETGGTAFFPTNLGQLPAMFKRIADELRNMYSLGYVSTDTDFDGKWRKIVVKTARSGLTVKARRGYYAEK